MTATTLDNMLLVTDKVFLSVVLVLSLPSTALIHVVLCMYALLAVRLVASDLIFIKSLGYGVASAPLVLLLESNDHHAVG